MIPLFGYNGGLAQTLGVGGGKIFKGLRWLDHRFNFMS
jgi:hypothetical protein